MRRRLLDTALLAASVLALSAAAFPPAARSVEPANASFKRQVQPIFNDFCVTCHQKGSAQQGLVLEEGVAYGSLVDRPSQQSKFVLVLAGMPSASYLMNKLDGSHITVGGKGARMPLGGELDTGLIEMIRAWIAAGAKDN